MTVHCATQVPSCCLVRSCDGRAGPSKLRLSLVLLVGTISSQIQVPEDQPACPLPTLAPLPSGALLASSTPDAHFFHPHGCQISAQRFKVRAVVGAARWQLDLVEWEPRRTDTLCKTLPEAKQGEDEIPGVPPSTLYPPPLPPTGRVWPDTVGRNPGVPFLETQRREREPLKAEAVTPPLPRRQTHPWKRASL